MYCSHVDSYVYSHFCPPSILQHFINHVIRVPQGFHVCYYYLVFIIWFTSLYMFLGFLFILILTQFTQISTPLLPHQHKLYVLPQIINFLIFFYVFWCRCTSSLIAFTYSSYSSFISSTVSFSLCNCILFSSNVSNSSSLKCLSLPVVGNVPYSSNISRAEIFVDSIFLLMHFEHLYYNSHSI